MLAIALVIAGGIATFIMIVGALDVLQSSRDSFYREYRFGDVLASLKRAPEGLRARIRAIPGVRRVDTRVVGGVRLDMPGLPEPVTGLAVSLPDRGKPPLNRAYLSQGRFPAAGRDNEAVVSQVFAAAHGLKPGDSLQAVINGRRQRLVVVGLGLFTGAHHPDEPGRSGPGPEALCRAVAGAYPLGPRLRLGGRL